MKKAPSPLVSLIPIIVLVLLLFATIRTFGSDALSGGSQVSLLTTTAICILIGINDTRGEGAFFMLILITFYLFSGYCFVYSRAKIQQKRMKSFASKRQAIKIIISLYLIGITIRSFHLLPETFISVFYTGLSIALILTGVLFIRYWWIRRKTFAN